VPDAHVKDVCADGALAFKWCAPAPDIAARPVILSSSDYARFMALKAAHGDTAWYRTAPSPATPCGCDRSLRNTRHQISSMSRHIDTMSTAEVNRPGRPRRRVLESHLQT
jgi:hypothetical protein